MFMLPRSHNITESPPRDLVLKKKRPVLVWFHGGNFVRGSAADYEPDYLLDEEFVLVTVNYRDHS